VFRNFDGDFHPEAQHTGYFNDADMMVIGMPGLNERENRVHFVLWSIAASPLILGADLTTLTPEIVATLTNDEILAVDRDPLGLQAIRISSDEQEQQIWVKLLAPTADGSERIAVALLNRSEAPASIKLPWSDLGLTTVSSIRDLWNHNTLGTVGTSLDAEVPGNDVAIFLLTAKTSHPTIEYLPAKVPDPENDPGPQISYEKEWVFDGVKSLKDLVPIRIDYVNKSASSELGEIRVNDERRSIAAFPPTAKTGSGSITIQLILEGGQSPNRVEVVFPANSAPEIRDMRVFPVGQRVDDAERHKMSTLAH
jgi:hypothetical protein